MTKSPRSRWMTKSPDQWLSDMVWFNMLGVLTSIICCNPMGRIVCVKETFHVKEEWYIQWSSTVPLHMTFGWVLVPFLPLEMSVPTTGPSGIIYRHCSPSPFAPLWTKCKQEKLNLPGRTPVVHDGVVHDVMPNPDPNKTGIVCTIAGGLIDVFRCTDRWSVDSEFSRLWQRWVK